MHEISKNRWAALGILALAQFLVVLDASIVNIALPKIGAAFSMDLGSLGWIITAYVLPFGGLLLLGGRMADRYGHRRVFLVGVAGFALASLGAGLSNSAATILVARAIQGASAALLAPAALALVSRLFPKPEERAKALGVWGAVAGLGGAAGVLFGGLLTSSLGWPWVFFVNVPVGALVLIFLPVLVSRDQRGQTEALDLPGALSVTIAMTVLVAALSFGPGQGWTSPLTLGLFGLAAVSLIVFVIVESKSQYALVPFRIFADRSLSAGTLGMLFLGGAMTGLFFALSVFMQDVLGYSALSSGLSQLPLAGTLIVVAGMAPSLLNRLGARTIAVAALAILATGLGWLAFAPAQADFVRDLLGPSIIMGLGLGAAFVALTQLTVSGVSDRDAGLAGGLFNASQQMGGAFGLALLSSVAASTFASLVGQGSPKIPALAKGFDAAFAGAAVLSAVAALFVLLIRERRARRVRLESV